MELSTAVTQLGYQIAIYQKDVETIWDTKEVTLAIFKNVKDMMLQARRAYRSLKLILKTCDGDEAYSLSDVELVFWNREVGNIGKWLRRSWREFVTVPERDMHARWREEWRELISDGGCEVVRAMLGALMFGELDWSHGLPQREGDGGGDDQRKKLGCTLETVCTSGQN